MVCVQQAWSYDLSSHDPQVQDVMLENKYELSPNRLWRRLQASPAEHIISWKIRHNTMALRFILSSSLGRLFYKFCQAKFMICSILVTNECGGAKTFDKGYNSKLDAKIHALCQVPLSSQHSSASAAKNYRYGSNCEGKNHLVPRGCWMWAAMFSVLFRSELNCPVYIPIRKPLNDMCYLVSVFPNCQRIHEVVIGIWWGNARKVGIVSPRTAK